MPGSYYFDYTVATDTWHLAYDPLEGLPDSQPEDHAFYSDGNVITENEWSTFVSPYEMSPNCGMGLILQLDNGELLHFLTHANPPAPSANVWFVQFYGRQITLRARLNGGELTLDYSEDESTWVHVTNFSPAALVSEVGLVLRYDDPAYPASAQAGFARYVPGPWEGVVQEQVLSGPPTGPALLLAPAVTTTTEPPVHAIIGAQFGDLEFDVGKCVRWITWFCDNEFILDINLGTQRYWVVNWTETFPDAKHRVTGVNYFYNPIGFRKEQWRLYQEEFGVPGDDDWILWLDAHEGLSVDNRSLPDDYDFEPFKSFLWREIQRAIDAGQPYAAFPVYVFLRSDNVTNVTYEMTHPVDPPVKQSMSVPYYLPYQGMRRLWKASELKKPDFDWTLLDAWDPAPIPGAKAQIISYGYAHWNLQDIPPGETRVPDLTEENDDGWRQRNLLSNVRPVPGLPLDDWQPPSADPVGMAGPWMGANPNSPPLLDPESLAPIGQPVPVAAGLEGILTPLYHLYFRINMRDGVWYEEGVTGNIPLRWDDTLNDWVSDYDPNRWNQVGVDAAV